MYAHTHAILVLRGYMTHGLVHVLSMIVVQSFIFPFKYKYDVLFFFLHNSA